MRKRTVMRRTPPQDEAQKVNVLMWLSVVVFFIYGVLLVYSETLFRNFRAMDTVKPLYSAKIDCDEVSCQLTYLGRKVNVLRSEVVRAKREEAFIYVNKKSGQFTINREQNYNGIRNIIMLSLVFILVWHLALFWMSRAREKKINMASPLAEPQA